MARQRNAAKVTVISATDDPNPDPEIVTTEVLLPPDGEIEEITGGVAMVTFALSPEEVVFVTPVKTTTSRICPALKATGDTTVH